MFLRPQRIAAYALVLWTIVKPLARVVENLQLMEDNSLQAMQTVGLDVTSRTSLVGDSDLLDVTSSEISLVTFTDSNVKDDTDNATDIAHSSEVCLYEDKPLTPSWISEDPTNSICATNTTNVTTDNHVKDRDTDKATDITQPSEVCLYKDKPLIPSWITEDPVNNVCATNTTNVTFTVIPTPRTFVPSPLPPHTTEPQPSSLFSAALLLSRYLELEFGTQSGCTCQGDSGTDLRRTLSQMAMNLLVSSLIQRLYLYILRCLRGVLRSCWRNLERGVGGLGMAVACFVHGLSMFYSRHPFHCYYDAVYELFTMLCKRGIIIVTTNDGTYGYMTVTGTGRFLLNPSGAAETTLAFRGFFKQADVKYAKSQTKDDTQHDRSDKDALNSFGRHSESLSMDQSSEDTEGTHQTHLADELGTNDPQEGMDSQQIINNKHDSPLVNSAPQISNMYECTNSDIENDLTVRLTSSFTPSSHDQSPCFDSLSEHGSDAIDAWFGANMSKEVEPIKVCESYDESEAGDCSLMETTEEHDSGSQSMMDPMEFKPIGHKYPRSQDARHMDMIESFNSQEARDYVADRCPFLFEDLETPPLTPTLPDTEGSPSDDADDHSETECADHTAIKVESSDEMLEIRDIQPKDSNSSTSLNEITVQVPTGVALSADSNEKLGHTSLTMITLELDNSIAVDAISIQPVAVAAIRMDMHVNGHDTLIGISDAPETSSEMDIAPLIADEVSKTVDPSQSSHLMLPNITIPTEDVFATSNSTQVVQPIDVWLPTYLEPELARIDELFETKGSTSNWQKREGFIMHLRGMLKGYTFRSFSKELSKGLAKNRRLAKTLNALSSSRLTTACITANYYSELAQTIGADFDPFVKIILPPLLRLSGSSHQSLVTCTQMALQTIIIHGIQDPRTALSILLRDFSTETNTQIRKYTMQHLTVMLRVHGNHRSLRQLRLSSSDVVAVALRDALAYADVGVRKAGRSCYWEFAEIWPEVALDIRKRMSNRAKGLLDKSKLDRSILDHDMEIHDAVEIPNVVVTDPDGDEVEPCDPKVWNGNQSYPPEAFSGITIFINPRYLAPRIWRVATSQ